MAKLYQKGDCYKLYLNEGTYEAPVWTEIPQASGLSIDVAKSDVEIMPFGRDTGHWHGHGDFAFNFVLMEDAASTALEKLIAGLMSDNAMLHLAVARDDLSLPGVVYWHCECVLFGGLTANQGNVASYDVEARRHGSSASDLKREQTPSAP